MTFFDAEAPHQASKAFVQCCTALLVVYKQYSESKELQQMASSTVHIAQVLATPILSLVGFSHFPN